ncbi:MAG: ATP-dependent DNA helicase RecG [Elusimicrobia bacterium]|nr:ATP-dependent DNA helicase RecG [Elusimicrobiota bacterium]
MRIGLENDVRYLKGVGEVRAGLLANLGITKVRHLLSYFPQRYEDRRAVTQIAMVNDQDTALVMGRITAHQVIKLRKGKGLIKVLMEDGSGRLTLLGFNQPYLKKILKKDSLVFVYGKFARTSRGLETSNFTYESIKQEGESHVNVDRIVPVYRLTAGLNQKWLRKIIFDTLGNLGEEFEEFIPAQIMEKEKLVGINRAIPDIHFPAETGDAAAARKRLVLGEFLKFQTALAMKRAGMRKVAKGRSYTLKKNILTPFKNSLNFEFTRDQKKAINEIFDDLMSEHPMRRLLQGEVGSGKTVVALSAMLLVIENGYMGVIVAPTEILAEQHYYTCSAYLKGLGLRISLLVGNMKKEARKKTLSDIAGGRTDVVVGTHALLQEDVDLSRAGILVIDEQHKFGVRQKAVLAGKAENIDILSMSATPIPRTVAMCTYGDLAVSTIKELPKDRKTPVTKYSGENSAYSFAVNQIKEGNLVYIVHPVIEVSDKTESKSAEERFLKLSRTVFRDYASALLHGRMSGPEKEGIMKGFARGEYRVLFTTTVIEVGIDIPRATVMIIENFNRYGLATLHQLRGRIARSSRKPYCFLTGAVTTAESKERLRIILSTNDGFKIAEEDLKLRGAGEMFGTRQHGMIDFAIGDPLEDFPLLEKARHSAFEIVEKDRKLRMKENVNLRKAVFREYKNRLHLAQIS